MPDHHHSNHKQCTAISSSWLWSSKKKAAAQNHARSKHKRDGSFPMEDELEQKSRVVHHQAPPRTEPIDTETPPFSHETKRRIRCHTSFARALTSSSPASLSLSSSSNSSCSTTSTTNLSWTDGGNSPVRQSPRSRHSLHTTLHSQSQGVHHHHNEAPHSPLQVVFERLPLHEQEDELQYIVQNLQLTSTANNTSSSTPWAWEGPRADQGDEEEHSVSRPTRGSHHSGHGTRRKSRSRRVTPRSDQRTESRSTRGLEQEEDEPDAVALANAVITNMSVVVQQSMRKNRPWRPSLSSSASSSSTFMNTMHWEQELDKVLSGNTGERTPPSSTM